MSRLLHLRSLRDLFLWRSYLQRRLYSIFVEQGDIVFAIGSHSTAPFSQLGAQVITQSPAAIDDLLTQYGTPTFAKVDTNVVTVALVEGLSRPIDALTFGYTTNNLELACAGVEKMAFLGRYRFGFTVGGRTRGEGWFSAETTLAYLCSRTSSDPDGDIFAIRSSSRAAQKLRLSHQHKCRDVPAARLYENRRVK